MHQSVVVVDAFADGPFTGNPAAVCVLPRPADERWMRLVAREMNLSETAFLHPEADGWRLRWLTPSVEVELCGHATLASAHVLWETGQLPIDLSAVFHTQSGRLTAVRRDATITLDFPARPAAESDTPAGLADALGARPCFVGQNGMDILVELESEQSVRELDPDHGRLRSLPFRGIIVTAPAASPGDYHFVSRFFAPGSGIDEDPVTGSAHCALGPFWSGRLGVNPLVGWQASARGGRVGVDVRGDRVLLTGRAVTTLRGELLHSSA
ncbi:MAG: PhzF family phenazine biosynthesis protein [Gemmataceae bacterium]|nr:PhzF family phenazine biosynthesis protein [Gemmataceae bacterium]